MEIIKLEKNTNKISKHIPYQITIYLVSRVEKLLKIPITFTIENEDDIIPISLLNELDKIVQFISKQYNYKQKKLLFLNEKDYENNMKSTKYGLRKAKPLLLTNKKEKDYKNNNFCYLCEHIILDNKSIKIEEKVKGHCRFSGKYLGPIHNKCNII